MVELVLIVESARQSRYVDEATKHNAFSTDLCG